METVIQTKNKPSEYVALAKNAHKNTTSLRIPVSNISIPSRLENVCNELGMLDVSLNEKTTQSTAAYHNLTVKVTPNHVRLSVTPKNDYGVNASASLNHLAYLISGDKTYKN